MKKRVLISVYDKSGIVELGKGLSSLGYEIVATGGSCDVLRKARINVVEVSKITGFPEVLDGRVKTLHPAIHSGILAKRNKKHLSEIKRQKISPIDIVIVNLYPFEEKPSVENIDIGGVSLLRSAAKNHESVLAVCSKEDYKSVIDGLRKGAITKDFRKHLAAKAFNHISYYDALISRSLGYLEDFPSKKVIVLKNIGTLRYGENPHQRASIYVLPNEEGRPGAMRQLQGKELSYNNYIDLDAAYNLVCEFKEPSCAIIKHTNPCGVASDKDAFTAYINAFSCDTVSAFGGIVAFNKTVDKKTAKEVTKTFAECVIAPAYAKDAIRIFSAKEDLRVLATPLFESDRKSMELRTISGGVLLQERDSITYGALECVTSQKPSKEAMKSLKFAMTVAKYVKSNAIILALGSRTVGIGAGQMSRIDALKIASMKMTTCVQSLRGQIEKPLVMASDAFFPFDDVVHEAYKIGVKAIIQPGGSIRDGDSKEACNGLGISMIFTGIRHFRH